MVGEREKRNLGAENVIVAQLRNKKKRRISEIPELSKVLSLEEAAEVSEGPTTSVDTVKEITPSDQAEAEVFEEPTTSASVDTPKDISVDISKETLPSAAVAEEPTPSADTLKASCLEVMESLKELFESKEPTPLADTSKEITPLDQAEAEEPTTLADTSKRKAPSSAAIEDADSLKKFSVSEEPTPLADTSKEITPSDQAEAEVFEEPTTSVDTPKDISVDISKETLPSAAVAEEPTPSADTLKASCLEVMEADGTLVRPATLPDRFKSQILNLAKENRYENPTLAQGAVPSDGEFPVAFLELPGQVEYMNQDAEGRDCFCNFRFCEKPNSRRLQIEDITSSSTDTTYGTVYHVHCSRCDNLLHRDCCLYDGSNPHDRVCGWCGEGVNGIESNRLLNEASDFASVFHEDDLPKKRFRYEDVRDFPTWDTSDSKYEMKPIECYICHEQVNIPKHSEFPFYRKYEVLGGNSKKHEKPRKMQETETRNIMYVHNIHRHVKDEVKGKFCHLFETCALKDFCSAKEERPELIQSDIGEQSRRNVCRALADSFMKVKLKAEHLSANPFTDCRAYFARWKTYVELPNVSARLARAATRYCGYTHEERATMNQVVSANIKKVVRDVVRGVHDLLEKQEKKTTDAFCHQAFQEQLFECMNTNDLSDDLARMIQRRMLALPELRKQVLPEP
jgi:hypothetical protein